ITQLRQIVRFPKILVRTNEKRLQQLFRRLLTMEGGNVMQGWIALHAECGGTLISPGDLDPCKDFLPQLRDIRIVRRQRRLPMRLLGRACRRSSTFVEKWLREQG